MDNRNVVIIIPTYNEALTIEQTIHEVMTVTSVLNNITVLIFDSCSTDNTQSIVVSLQKIYPNLCLKTEHVKSGLGSAYLQAMRYSLVELGATIVIEFDADLSHQPRYLIPMIELMQHNDVVVGSRYIKGGSIPSHWGFHRKLLSRLGNLISRLMLTLKYKDFTSGLRATHHVALQKALPKQFISNHYAYKLELLWNLHKTKAKIVEYPIAFLAREKGYSKLPTNSIGDALRVLGLLRFKELKPYLSMCFIGVLGLLVQCGLYNLLRHSLAPFFSAQLAVSAAIVNNFLLNNRFTFKSRGVSNRFKAGTFFIAYSLAMVTLQSYWVHWGVSYFGEGYLRENLIIISGIILGSILNYFVFSRIIWPKRSQLTQTLKQVTD